MTLDLMDGKELEVYLGGKLSYWTLLELAKAGELPHIRIGRRVFFRKQAIDAWLIELETGSVKKQAEETPRYGQLRKIHV